MSNIRVTISIVAFVTAFIFSAGLVRIIFPAPVVQNVYSLRTRTFERSSNEIEAFLLQDIRNGEQRNDLSYTNNFYADEVMSYWKMSSSMDASGFPQDFQNAWSLHMQAWGDYAEYLQAKKVSRNGKSCGLDKQYTAEINRTWGEVLRIGRTYGAYVE